MAACQNCLPRSPNGAGWRKSERARPLRGGSGWSPKGGGAENGAPVAKRRTKRIARGVWSCVLREWRDKKVKTRWLAWERVGVFRESFSLSFCPERFCTESSTESSQTGSFCTESSSALWTESRRSRVVGEARVRTPSDTNQRHLHVQARAQCPTPEGPEERSRRGTTRPGKSQLSSSFPWVFV